MWAEGFASSPVGSEVDDNFFFLRFPLLATESLDETFFKGALMALDRLLLLFLPDWESISLKRITESVFLESNKILTMTATTTTQLTVDTWEQGDES